MKTNTSLYKLLFFVIALGAFTTVITSCEEDLPTFEDCTNGIDDDGDGLVDCDDPDCTNNSNCILTGDPQVTLAGSLGTRTLSKDTIYILDRFVYVADGDILTIEPGTIIKANTGDGADASALIVARGAKLLAEGTSTNPIIFTSVSDGIKIGETESTLNAATDAGKWGGLIVLGKAPISAKLEDGDTETDIEGVPPTFSFATYGGAVTSDNSGSLSYLSIRFTGTKLANNSEIQGLTLGGVGNGTTIQNIEIISSLDDGVEIFGGSVNVSKVLIAYQADDGIDLDQSYRGTVSNSKVLIFNPDEGNDAMEIDGPEGPSNTTGLFTITNCSFINKGAGNCRAARMKSGAQGTITNCSFEDFTNWLFVDGDDATSNFTASTLQVTNSEFDKSNLDNVIGASAEVDSITALFNAAGNVATSTITKGSTADFSWTWSNDLNLLN